MITFPSARNHSTLSNLPRKLSVAPLCQRLPRSIKAVPMGDAQIDTAGGPHLAELEVTKRNQVSAWGPP
jgi:hypothetical protein